MTASSWKHRRLEKLKPGKAGSWKSRKLEKQEATTSQACRCDSLYSTESPCMPCV